MFRLIVLASFMMLGLYTEFTSAAAGLLMTIWLIAWGRKNTLRIILSPGLISIAVIFVFYLLSMLWAVDSGLASGGAVKMFPILIFCICISQFSEEERAVLLQDLPVIGCVMTLTSLALQFVPALHESFMINERLGGWFEYPNTFACFLLTGFIILQLSEQSDTSRAVKTAQEIILCLGIGLSGSRIVFVMFALFLLTLLILKLKNRDRNQNKEILFTIVIAAAGLAVAGLAGAALSVNGMQHIGTIASNPGTMVGRLLYWKDAAGLMAKHPLGLGYLGYYFVQGSIQTGVYSVRWVHNGLIQLVLDIGWIPVLLFIYAFGASIISGKTTLLHKAVMITVAVHSLADFDMQFGVMAMVLMMCFSWEGREKICSKSFAGILAVILICFNIAGLYAGTAAELAENGPKDLAYRIAPWNTFAALHIMTDISSPEELNQIADKVLNRNEYATLAWDAKANIAYSEGDFAQVIQCKHNAISTNRYSMAEYIDYFEKLKVGAGLYMQAGDQESADICNSEIAWIQEALNDMENQTSSLARKIADQPQLQMPDEYYDYIGNW